MKPVDWRRTKLGKYLRHFPRPKHLKGSWLHRKLGDNLLHPDLWKPERQHVAAGFALGAFFSMIPMPFQTLPTVLLGYFTRVNLGAAIIAVWISNPLTTPIILYLQYRLGAALLGIPAADPRIFEAGNWIHLLKTAPLPLLLGGMITGIVCSAISYPITLWAWDRITSAVRKARLHRHGKKWNRGKTSEDSSML